MNGLCVRCRKADATHSLRFRIRLGYTEAALVCEPCIGPMTAAVGDRAIPQVVALDTRPGWMRRLTAKDLTGVA